MPRFIVQRTFPDGPLTRRVGGAQPSTAAVPIRGKAAPERCADLRPRGQSVAWPACRSGGLRDACNCARAKYSASKRSLHLGTGGPEGIYFVCWHCGREKPGYGPPVADSIG